MINEYIFRKLRHVVVLWIYCSSVKTIALKTGGGHKKELYFFDIFK